MAAIVEISAVETTVNCDEKGNAEHKITVHNISGRELRVGARVLLDPPAKNEWVGPLVRSDKKEKKETEWMLAENDTIQLTVPIKAGDAAEGGYSFRVEVFSTEAPGEDYVTGNTLAFKVPAQKVKPVKEDKKKFPMWIIGVIVGVLVLVGGGVAAWLIMSGDAEVNVPDLVTMSFDEVEAVLDDSSLKLGDVREQATGDGLIGTVVSQNPEADTTVEENSAVDIVIEAEPSPEPEVVSISVPQLVSMSFEVAESTLIDDGLKLGPVTEQITGNHPIGTVISQNPEARAKVEENSAVDIVIEAVSMVVPNLVGKFSAEAQEMLTMENLVLADEIIQKRTGQNKGGIVIEQNPPEGERVRPGTVVSITVEKEKIPVPSVIGQTQVEASRILSSEGFRLGRIRERRTGGTPGVVLSQNPTANSQVAPGTPITLVVEEKKIAVPRLIGMTLKTAGAKLKGLGLRTGSVSKKVTGKKRNTIIAQRPSAGTQVRPGTSVALVVEFQPRLVKPLAIKTLPIKNLRLLKQNLNLTRGITPKE
jgi:beta-lactam-binding protein with PASTA domain